MKEECVQLVYITIQQRILITFNILLITRNIFCNFFNKQINMRSFLLTIGFCFITVSIIFSQPSSTQPIEYVKRVADRLIAHSALELKATVTDPQKGFQNIETIDFGRSFRTYQGVAYAYTNLETEKAQSIDFQILSQGTVQVWLNEKMIIELATSTADTLLENERSWVMPNSFTCPLKQGTNHLLIKAMKATATKPWKVMLQPLIPLPEEGDVEVHKAPLTFALSSSPLLDSSLDKITNWLVLGPFAAKDAPAMEKIFQPQMGNLFASAGEEFTWEIPKIELTTDVLEAHPLWGSLYDWNYHTAGVAWALGHLGIYTGDAKYTNYMDNYCDFMLSIKPYIFYEKYTANKLNSRFARLWNSQLLDFKVAPILPFAYRLRIDQSSTFQRKVYASLVHDTEEYLNEKQLRLTDGTLARETPQVYTVWADDMFMGLPFMLEASQLSTSETEKMKWLTQAAQQIILFNEKLFDKSKNLYHHAWFSTAPSKELPYWSRANGWGIWAASEVLLYLPKGHPLYGKILTIYKDHAAGVVKYQDPLTGFYPNLLDEPKSFKETSGTAIITMAVARGVNKGWLNAKRYTPYAMKGWQALTSIISSSGEVTDICMGTMCSEDRTYYRNRPIVDNDSHGLLGLIFAGIEMQELTQKNRKR